MCLMADLGKVLPVFGLLDHALMSGCLIDQVNLDEFHVLFLSTTGLLTIFFH